LQPEALVEERTAQAKPLGRGRARATHGQLARALAQNPQALGFEARAQMSKCLCPGADLTGLQGRLDGSNEAQSPVLVRLDPGTGQLGAALAH